MTDNAASGDELRSKASLHTSLKGMHANAVQPETIEPVDTITLATVPAGEIEPVLAAAPRFESHLRPSSSIPEALMRVGEAQTRPSPAWTAPLYAGDVSSGGDDHTVNTSQVVDAAIEEPCPLTRTRSEHNPLFDAKACRTFRVNRGRAQEIVRQGSKIWRGNQLERECAASVLRVRRPEYWFRRKIGGRIAAEEPRRTGAGIWLPRSVVEDVGFRTRKGKVKHDLFFIARAALLFKLYGREAGVLPYRQGFEIEVEEGAFVSSEQALIESAYARLYKRIIPPDPLRDADFKRFYERCHKDFVRRISPAEPSAHRKQYLFDIGPAVSEEHVPGKSRDLFGKKWTLAPELIEVSAALPASRPRPMVLCSVPPQEPPEDEFVDVIGYLESVVAYECGLHRAFTHAVTRSSLKARGRVSRYLDWMRRQAQDRQGFRHVSVGAFREHEGDSEHADRRACYVPFLVADIDVKTSVDARENLRLAYCYARLLVERLVALGCDSLRLVVSYTGGGGFHVRIPAGMLGNPLFRTGSDAKCIISRLFGRITKGVEGPVGSLTEFLDEHVFSPNVLIRAVGSEHEDALGEHGERQYCVAFTGEEFLGLDLALIEQYSRFYSPFRLRRPEEAAAVPALVEMAIVAAIEVEQVDRPWQNKGIIEAIRDGVGKSELYAAGRRGRKQAAFQYALWLITRRKGSLSLDEAWAELEQ